MAVIPVTPGVTRAVLNFTYQGQQCNNVLHFKQAGAGVAPDPVALGGRLANWWTSSQVSKVPISCCLNTITCTDLGEEGAPGSITTVNALAQCGTSTNAAPNNVTCVFSIRTALRGRSFRGRIYHVGIDEVNVDDNRLIPAYRAALLTSYTSLVVLTGGIGSADFQLGVLSTQSNGAVRPSGLFTPATAITTDGIIDSQRRRLPGRGR